MTPVWSRPLSSFHFPFQGQVIAATREEAERPTMPE